jgi:hypothetical protein
VGFSTSGLASGDLAVVGQQKSSAVSTTGRYVYSMQLYLATPAVSRTVSGTAFVVAEDNSPYGAGWTMAGVDKLVSVTATLTYAAGLLREYGSGGVGFYTDNGAGGYTSPAGDNGTYFQFFPLERFRVSASSPVSLGGKTLGILGLGAIGSLVAYRALPTKMRSM